VACSLKVARADSIKKAATPKVAASLFISEQALCSF
jgi:hypothetical protein